MLYDGLLRSDTTSMRSVGVGLIVGDSPELNDISPRVRGLFACSAKILRRLLRFSDAVRCGLWGTGWLAMCGRRGLLGAFVIGMVAMGWRGLDAVLRLLGESMVGGLVLRSMPCVYVCMCVYIYMCVCMCVGLMLC